jgi:ABC-type thiamine transport system substrate-binding protein
LPAVFRKFAIPPPSVLDDPTEIGAHRKAWLDRWTQIVLR